MQIQDHNEDAASSTRDRMLRVDQVMERLQIGRSGFYKLANAGRLKVVKLGRWTRVREADLIEFQNNLPTIAKTKAA